MLQKGPYNRLYLALHMYRYSTSACAKQPYGLDQPLPSTDNYRCLVGFGLRNIYRELLKFHESVAEACRLYRIDSDMVGVPSQAARSSFCGAERDEYIVESGHGRSRSTQTPPRTSTYARSPAATACTPFSCDRRTCTRDHRLEREYEYDARGGKLSANRYCSLCWRRSRMVAVAAAEVHRLINMR